ncbi:hypothetical protein BWQ96_03379 [Gracilariopsis chorda]|uniref:Uncharacterized protein n=1 Tax=Gracilariopsis chorda TaxID=448386 RepID=A0A2V3J0F9_9FLOR|nr:hypothetical protein BWQ96_03379 [Gracilariopsis chorda]|eukprot:PXF46850.1 hypothetical protein BWQ96_03379 [Gracilariopsis chorda]
MMCPASTRNKAYPRRGEGAHRQGVHSALFASPTWDIIIVCMLLSTHLTKRLSWHVFTRGNKPSYDKYCSFEWGGESGIGIGYLGNGTAALSKNRASSKRSTNIIPAKEIRMRTHNLAARTNLSAQFFYEDIYEGMKSSKRNPH